MFNKIQTGDKVFVDGKEYEVTRVSNARFWIKMGDEDVKFIKTNGKEYGSKSVRKATTEAVPPEDVKPAEEAKPKKRAKKSAKQAETPVAEEVTETPAE